MDLLDRMTTFVRIVDTGTLSAAARATRRSLAAVSRQLAALEHELGATLVVRSTRRLQVTDAGRRWYQHCVHLLGELDTARRDITGDDEPRGRVVISAPVTLGLDHVVPRLDRLARRHAELIIELRLEDHPIDLIGDAVDIAVRGGMAPPDSPAIVAHAIRRFDRVVVAAPGYLRQRGTPRHPRDLAGHDGLVQGGGRTVRTTWRFSRGDDAIDVSPRERLRCNAPIALRDWARAGAGIALLPDWLAGDDRGLTRLLTDWSVPPVQVWALHRLELRGAPRVRAVIDALRAGG